MLEKLGFVHAVLVPNDMRIIGVSQAVTAIPEAVLCALLFRVSEDIRTPTRNIT